MGELCPQCETALRVNPDEEFSVTLNRHLDSDACRQAIIAKEDKKKTRCPVDKCKNKLTQSGSVVCNTCHQRVCLKHRFEDSHPCKAWACTGSRSSRGCSHQALSTGVASLLGLERLPMPIR